MGDFTESQNPYIILGLEKGFESTDAEIRKVSNWPGTSPCDLEL